MPKAIDGGDHYLGQQGQIDKRHSSKEQRRNGRKEQKQKQRQTSPTRAAAQRRGRSKALQGSDNMEPTE